MSACGTGRLARESRGAREAEGRGREKGDSERDQSEVADKFEKSVKPGLAVSRWDHRRGVVRIWVSCGCWRRKENQLKGKPPTRIRCNSVSCGSQQTVGSLPRAGQNYEGELTHLAFSCCCVLVPGGNTLPFGKQAKLFPTVHLCHSTFMPSRRGKRGARAMRA